ncbi:hypothetical protein EDI_103830 [Entamoeba dispar SAW760]|uniref:Uncharacterized protein n=1 Tax=Entamoeba dispar (strain ATCC PRA-260 / SAW760) TaxID=370354 RepID=B0ELX1_ENTDS|nr:uncharacterized protein EDI_103830 [Entamoeba dispar SAW760]EDR24476.1 hypothetical protein EDI_103830 [Entamoeba dispar SAW760]|eukprot:EDR24476.1 hypothetical protein EDI_103830 [Entamoeba dispar SAW760]
MEHNKWIDQINDKNLFNKLAELRSENIRQEYDKTYIKKIITGSSNLSICQKISLQMRNINSKNIEILKQEISKYNCKRYLQEYISNMMQNSFEDGHLIINYVELCCLFSQYYENDFCKELNEILLQNSNIIKKSFGYYIFIVELFLVSLPIKGHILKQQFIEGLTFYLQSQSKEEITITTKMYIPEIIYLLNLIGSVFTTIHFSSPNLQESLNQILCEDQIIKEKICILIGKRDKFTDLFTEYKKRVDKYCSIGGIQENQELINILFLQMGYNMNYTESKEEIQSKNLCNLYDDNETRDFYTVFPSFSDIKQQPLKTHIDIKIKFKKYIEFLKQIEDEKQVNSAVRDFLTTYKHFVFKTITIKTFLHQLISKITSKYNISLYSKYFYLIQLQTKENIASIILKLFENSINFGYISNCIIILSEFFKFSLDKTYLMEAYDYLFSTDCPLSSINKLRLIYNSMDFCCRHYVNLFEESEQLSNIKIFQQLSRTTIKKEKNECMRLFMKIKRLLDSTQNIQAEEDEYIPPQELFLQHLFSHPSELTLQQRIILLRKFNYEDPEICELIIKHLMDSLINGAFINEKDVVIMAIQISQWHPKILVSVIDQLIYCTTFGFEHQGVMSKQHRIVYVAALAHLYNLNGISDTLIFKIVDIIHKLSKYYPENDGHLSRKVTSLYSGNFGARLLIKIFSICIDKMYSKKPLWVLKMIINIQISMNNKNIKDLETDLNEVLKKINFPRMRGTLGTTELKKVFREISQKNYTLEQIKIIIDRAYKNIQCQLDAEFSSRIDELKRSEEAKKKELEEIRIKKEIEKKKEQEKIQRMTKEVDESEFIDEVTQNIKEMTEMAPDGAISNETQVVMALDPRNFQKETGKRIIVVTSDGKSKTLNLDEEKENKPKEEITPIPKPQKKKVKIILPQ